MKAQPQPQLQGHQDQQQWWQEQAANDPDYQMWLDQRSFENQAAFEAFLDTRDWFSTIIG